MLLCLYLPLIYLKGYKLRRLMQDHKFKLTILDVLPMPSSIIIRLYCLSARLRSSGNRNRVFRFVFITGCTSFKDSPIFDAVNNVRDVSEDPKFKDIVDF